MFEGKIFKPIKNILTKSFKFKFEIGLYSEMVFISSNWLRYDNRKLELHIDLDI